MAGTSVDEAQNYCLKRRTRDGTASAQKQQEALNRVSEYPRREEEETKVGVGKRTAQMWRERGTKRGRERKRERERGTNFDVVQTHTRSRQLFNVNAHKTSNPMHKHKINESSQDPVRFEATRRQPTTDNGEPAIPWSESMHLWFRRTHSSVSVYV
ncbi:unnamed protein product [Fusarium graminearum]|nr:unnamed protein product [Fusarium graminearum]